MRASLILRRFTTLLLVCAVALSGARVAAISVDQDRDEQTEGDGGAKAAPGRVEALRRIAPGPGAPRFGRFAHSLPRITARISTLAQPAPAPAFPLRI